jgi:hypothetical protein
MILQITYKIKGKWDSKTITFQKGDKMLKKLDFLKKCDILKSHAPIRLKLGYEGQESQSAITERLISILENALNLSQKILKNL